MDPFHATTGPACPLMAANVDTDVIVRIQRLTDLEPDALGPYAFETWRYRPDGTPDPAFVLNRPPWTDATILLAGPNFGCGSSREGAVWALKAFGIRAIIAPSFGAIFYNNMFQNGMMPVVLPAPDIEALAGIARAQPDAPFQVDLQRQVVVPPNGTPLPFEVEARRREALLNGLDDLGLTLKRDAQITSFEGADRQARPWAHEPGA